MADKPLPDPPIQLKAIQSYMKTAADIERVDPVVAYWVRLYCTETALTIDRDSPDSKLFLKEIISWLEKFKQANKTNEAVSNQVVGQAHFENFVVGLFNKADTLDREGTANKTTIRMFFMAAVLFESMVVFGPLTEEISKRVKYAKFKAAYIQKCLKTGQTPKPGPIEDENVGDPSYSQTEVPPNEPSSTIKPPTGPTGAPDAPTVAKPDNPDPFILTPSAAPVYPPQAPAKPSVPSSTPSKPQASYSDQGELPGSASKPSSNASMTGSSTISATKFTATNGATLTAEDILKGQKYCKFATSALQYDDIHTAVDNLEKALRLLKTGQRE